MAILVDEDMSHLWDRVTEHTWLVNDLISGKKEIMQENVSLLPLLYANTGSLQSAVDEIVAAVRTSAEDFDIIAERLRKKCKNDAALLQDLEVFMNSCRYNCTGNVGWSLMTGRYGMEQCEQYGEGLLLLKI